MFGKLRTAVAPKPAPPPAGAPGAKPAPAGRLVEEMAGAEREAGSPEKSRLKGTDEKLEKYYALKTRIHRKLVEQLDMSAVDNNDPTIRDQVGELILALCEKENVLLNHAERQKLVSEILDETFGLGPLELLLKIRPSAIFSSTARAACTWSAAAGSK
jgi:pilus assembly protein CpaF